MHKRIKTVEPNIDPALPTLGIQSFLQWSTDKAPRMQWMSELLDKVGANQELLSDPLRILPPAAKELLLELPHIAWPTIFLFLGNFLVMIIIALLAEFGFLYMWFASLLLTFSMFVMFSVSHDASHGSISNIRWINGLVGRISFATIGPFSTFALFRYVHLLHHKFTNDPERDPDAFCAHGGFFTLPFRCLLLPVSYFVYYTARIHTRPLLEIMEIFGHLAITLGLVSGGIERGLFLPILFYWIIPSILAHGLLGFFFDYIPHHHEEATTPIQSRYHTTSILQTYWFVQPFLSILLQYQDYHLIHHLYPTIPFYRYADKWIEKQEFLLEKNVSVNRLTVAQAVINTKQTARQAMDVVKNTKEKTLDAVNSTRTIVDSTVQAQVFFS